MKWSGRTIPFVKASACGNDFLLIDADLAPGDVTDFSRRLCDRHEGIGADGVEWMSSSSEADVDVRLINADGTEAEISGNGTRCVAAYICANQRKEKISIKTGAGVKTCVLTGRSEMEYEFEMAMGGASVEQELSVGRVRGIPLSMGNPHFVIFVPDFDESWQSEAARIQRTGAFENGVNVEFVVLDGKHDLKVRFFERGVGETQSSGTGSCAAAVAAMATRSVTSPVRIHAPGGVQTVRVEGEDVFLRGPARLVFSGEFSS